MPAHSRENDRSGTEGPALRAAIEAKGDGSTLNGATAAGSAAWHEAAANAAAQSAEETFAAILSGTRATLQQSLALVQRSARTLQQCDQVLERSAQLHFLATNSREICRRLAQDERASAGEWNGSKPAEQQRGA